MHHVFISYSSKDMNQAKAVSNILQENQIITWMAPGDIPGGSNYTKEIPLAIRGCQVFLLILSPNAQNSQWVFRELDMAVNEGKVILPFMLEDFLLNDEFNFLLTGAQRYAAYQKKAEELQRLVQRIHFIISEDISRQEISAPESERIPDKEIQMERPVIFTDGLVHCPNCGSDHVSPHVPRMKCKTFANYLLCGFYTLVAIVFTYIASFFILMLLVVVATMFSSTLPLFIFYFLFLISTFYGIYKGRRMYSEHMLNMGNLRGFFCENCNNSFTCKKPYETYSIHTAKEN